MSKTLLKWELSGSIFSFLIGTLFHFIYAWSGYSPVAGLFGAVNESSWEHLKMAFWPMLIFMLIEGRFMKEERHNFLAAKIVSLYLAPVIILVLFYAYVGFGGPAETRLAFTISEFGVAILVSQFVSYKIQILPEKSPTVRKVAIGCLVLILACFLLFTVFPPQIFLFQDPNSLLYGFPQ